MHISISPNTHFRSPFRGYFRICGHDKSAPTAADGLPKHCWRSAKMQRTHREKYTKQPQNTWRTLRKHPRNNPSGVGADSSRPHPDIIKYVYPFHRIRILTLSNTHIHFTTHVFSHYWIYTFISSNTHFRSPFRGYIHICGHDKSAPTAANGLPKHCWRSAKMQRTHREKYTKQPQNTWRTLRKHPTNTPQGVGADSSRPYPDIIKYTYPFHRIRILTLSNAHIHFISNVHSSPISWVFSYMRAR